jgi:hypothetical protein
MIQKRALLNLASPPLFGQIMQVGPLIATQIEEKYTTDKESGRSGSGGEGEKRSHHERRFFQSESIELFIEGQAF